MEIRNIPGMGPCLVFTATDGTRHRVRMNSIQAVGDSDEMQNEMALVVAGRAYMIPQPLDTFDRIAAEAEADRLNY